MHTPYNPAVTVEQQAAHAQRQGSYVFTDKEITQQVGRNTERHRVIQLAVTCENPYMRSARVSLEEHEKRIAGGTGWLRTSQVCFTFFFKATLVDLTDSKDLVSL